MPGKIKKLLTFAAILAITTSQITYAQYSSSNYKVEETLFGAGGELDIASPGYKARASAGELGVGNTASANYQAYAGFNTTDEPMLEVVVAGGTFDLGYLELDTPKATTASFQIRSHISSGYIVTLGGTAPKNLSGGHTLASINPAAAINASVDQFGVNLAANNVAPIGPFGAAPQQVPDASFGFGTAATDYGTSNLFKYIENQTIASSNRSSGVTQYTLSMIASAGKNAPAGLYTTDLFVNVTPTF